MTRDITHLEYVAIHLVYTHLFGFHLLCFSSPRAEDLTKISHEQMQKQLEKNHQIIRLNKIYERSSVAGVWLCTAIKSHAHLFVLLALALLVPNLFSCLTLIIRIVRYLSVIWSLSFSIALPRCAPMWAVLGVTCSLALGRARQLPITFISIAIAGTTARAKAGAAGHIRSYLLPRFNVAFKW